VDSKQVVLVLLFFPLVAFGWAAVTEARSHLRLGERIGRLIPILCGVAAFLAWFDPQGVFHVTPSGTVWVSRIMTIVSAVIACSGVFTTYSRRSTAILVALGGLVLALAWMFNVVLV
jgi:hypothetical protein